MSNVYHIRDANLPHEVPGCVMCGMRVMITLITVMSRLSTNLDLISFSRWKHAVLGRNAILGRIAI